MDSDQLSLLRALHAGLADSGRIEVVTMVRGLRHDPIGPNRRSVQSQPSYPPSDEYLLPSIVNPSFDGQIFEADRPG
jgi:hypothetical protein